MSKSAFVVPSYLRVPWLISIACHFFFSLRIADEKAKFLCMFGMPIEAERQLLNLFFV